MSKEFGTNGSLLKAAGALTSGPYNIIVALEDSDITVESTWVGADSPEPLTLVAGQTVYGVFSTITWGSGKIVAHK